MEKNALLVQVYLKLEEINVKYVDIIRKIVNMNVMNVKKKVVIMINILMLLILFNVLITLIQMINIFMDALLHISIKRKIGMNVLLVLQDMILYLLKMKKYVKDIMKLV